MDQREVNVEVAVVVKVAVAAGGSKAITAENSKRGVVGEGVAVEAGRVRKSHCLVFLGGLDPGQAPLKTLLLMLGLT